MTGSISDRVTLRKVCQRDAPDMRLASSSEGSIALKASTMNITRKAVEYCAMCQTTPP